MGVYCAYMYMCIIIMHVGIESVAIVISVQ